MKMLLLLAASGVGALVAPHNDEETKSRNTSRRHKLEYAGRSLPLRPRHLETMHPHATSKYADADDDDGDDGKGVRRTIRGRRGGEERGR